jgi:hypothetical protein
MPPPQVDGFICNDVVASGRRRAFEKRILWIILSHIAFDRLSRLIFGHDQGQGGNQPKPGKPKPGKPDQPDKSTREDDKGSQRVKKLKKIKGLNFLS